jgi:triphosphoribosyl-dephospho-CoA synthetase
MNCLNPSALETLAAALVRGARLELHLTPKPGLVDRADCGSHPDLSMRTMERSIDHVSDYLDEMVASLAGGQSFAEQRAIGAAAERRLLETLGTNTHKGFIFLSGILLIARSNAGSSDETALRESLRSLADDFFKTAPAQPTNGLQARKKYQCGGIILESIGGFPSVFDEGLPAFRQVMGQSGSFEAASFALLARLMQTVDDTTTLHRAGVEGLCRVRRDGLRLEQIVAEGGDYLAFLRELNRSYVLMNITIGGVADMLGIAYACLIASGEIPPSGEA